MHNTLNKFFIFFLFIICTVQAAPEQHSTLKKLNQKIASIQATLSADQNKRVTFLHSLKITEIAAGQASIKLQQTTTALRKQQNTLQQLEKNTSLYRTQLTT